MNSAVKNQQMTLSLQWFPEKYLWLEQNSHIGDQIQNLNWIPEVPIDIMFQRRLDWEKFHPVQK